MLSIDLPTEKALAIEQISQQLGGIPNVGAVVLGGSYARGLARPDSDLDIGIYYRQDAVFSVDAIRAVARRISLPGAEPTVTEFYEWGPWVNGGAWIQTRVGKVDFLYRNIDQLELVIREGTEGIWRHDYDQQPPYGFRSVVYFGEVYFAIPLYDPAGEIARLKEMVARYPEALKQRVVEDSLWGAEFSLALCRGFADRADVANAVGCMTRAAQYLTHAIFALNEEYFVSDKWVSRVLDEFSNCPRDFRPRLAGILANPGAESTALRRSVEALEALWRETGDLTGGSYRSRYRL